MDAIQYFLRMPKSLGMGHFKLSPGMHSNVYMQCAQVLCDPDFAQTLGQMIASKFKHLDVELVISPVQGGVLIGQPTAQALNRLHYYIEKDKEGGFTLRRGFEITPGTKVLIVESVWTTAGSAVKVYKAVDKDKGVVVGMASIVNRMGISGEEWPDDIKNKVTRESLINLTDTDIITKLPAQFGNPFQVDPEDCPLCKKQVPLQTPGSGSSDGKKS